jgi:hypothetical protein
MKPKIEYTRYGAYDKAWIPFEINDRKAKCLYCEQLSKTNPILPYFEAKEHEPLDTYYCGCRGWD